MSTEPTATGLTYDDLLAIPEDNVRRDLIDGELFVTPAPTRVHQRVVLELGSRLLAYAKKYGGEAHAAPLDIYLSHADVVEPDVLFVREEHMGRFEEGRFIGAPDLVVEVSSPSTRSRDRVRKRDLYERFGVQEYWFVDLEDDRVEVYRLEGGRYGAPLLLGHGQTLASSVLPGFAVAVDDLVGPAGR